MMAFKYLLLNRHLVKKSTVALFVVLFITTSITICTHSVSAQQPTSIPNWVKGIAGWWAEGKISDQDFQQDVQFLVDTGIIKVHNATSVITDLQSEASKLQSNSTQTKLLDASNQTVLSYQTYDSLARYSGSWIDGKISDTEYFKVLQNVINIGGYGPFTGPQKTGIPTYQVLVPNTNPKTITVEIPLKQDNETISILMDDSIKFVSADNSPDWMGWEVIGNARGAGNYPSSNSHFDIGLESKELLQRQIESNNTDPYTKGNLKLPPDTYKFISNGGVTWDCSYYYTNDHIGKDFTINVTVQFKNMTGIDPMLKQNMISVGNGGHSFTNYTVEEFYRMGLVHNPPGYVQPQIKPDYSNKIVVVPPKSKDPLQDAAYKWSKGKISNSVYFAVVQSAIDAGKIGPFHGTQYDKNRTSTDLEYFLRPLKEETLSISSNDVLWKDESGFRQYLGTVETLYDFGWVNNTKH